MGITRSELLTKKCERRCKSVTVGGESYYLRSLTAREWSDVKAVLAFSDRSREDWFEYNAALLISMLSDEAGNQLLLPDDIDKLAEMPPLLFTVLVDAAQEFLGEESVGEAKKN